MFQHYKKKKKKHQNQNQLPIPENRIENIHINLKKNKNKYIKTDEFHPRHVQSTEVSVYNEKDIEYSAGVARSRTIRERTGVVVVDVVVFVVAEAAEESWRGGHTVTETERGRESWEWGGGEEGEREWRRRDRERERGATTLEFSGVAVLGAVRACRCSRPSKIMNENCARPAPLAACLRYRHSAGLDHAQSLVRLFRNAVSYTTHERGRSPYIYRAAPLSAASRALQRAIFNAAAPHPESSTTTPRISAPPSVAPLPLGPSFPRAGFSSLHRPKWLDTTTIAIDWAI